MHIFVFVETSQLLRVIKQLLKLGPFIDALLILILPFLAVVLVERRRVWNGISELIVFICGLQNGV